MTTSHQPAATGQILNEKLDHVSGQLETLMRRLKSLEEVIRSEQEHTRQALHIVKAGLEKERGT